MIKKLIILLILATVNYQVLAQSDSKKNHVYLELMGKGFYYSINYERVIVPLNDKLYLRGSIGFCLAPGTTDLEKSTDFVMPLELNLSYNLKNNHHVSLGYGTSYWRYYLPFIDISNENLDLEPIQPKLKKVTEWFAHMSLDYRYEKADGGLSFKAGFTPLFFAKMQNFAYTKKTNYSPSFNAGIGYIF